MNARIFGRTGRPVGEVGLGTWQLGSGWGAVSEDTALATLGAAYEAGTTLFDTADVYGPGRSEEAIGRFLRETPGARERVFVATKCGRSASPGWPGNFTRETMRSHVEASLRRLGLEAVDLIQFHCLPLDVLRRGEVFENVRELKREGKVKDFGASVESMEEADFCIRQEGVAALQIIFNIFRQKPAQALFAEAKRRQVALLIRLPLASGLLAGKLRKDTPFPPDDHRSFNRDGQRFNVGETFAGLPFEKGLDLVEALRPLVPPGLSLADFALRWCLDHDAVTAVIPGAKKPEQARANARASSLPPLGADLHRRLADFYAREVAPHIRGPL